MARGPTNALSCNRPLSNSIATTLCVPAKELEVKHLFRDILVFCEHPKETPDTFWVQKSRADDLSIGQIQWETSCGGKSLLFIFSLDPRDAHFGVLVLYSLLFIRINRCFDIFDFF